MALSNYKGAVEIMKISEPRFTNATDGDMVIYPTHIDQSLLLGVTTNVPSPAMIKLSGNTMSVNADVHFQGNVQHNGLVRIDRSGALSNVAILANSTTVYIDANRITSGTVPQARLPNASVNTTGIVRLSSSTSSSCNNSAATSFAVKKAYDLAQNTVSLLAAYTASNIMSVYVDAGNIIYGQVAIEHLPIASTSEPGIVLLSDAINSNSSTEAATSKAVYETYAMVLDALETASNAHDLAHQAMMSSNSEVFAIANAALPKSGGEMTGQILAPSNDSISAPSYSWASGNRDTGMYLDDGLGHISFAISGSQVAYMTPSNLCAPQLLAFTQTGTAPMVVASTTRVDNLNAQYLDGQSATYFKDASKIETGIISEARLPTASTSSNGIVQLSDSTNSLSSMTAATSYAVTQAYAKAELAYNTMSTVAIDTSRLTGDKIERTLLPAASVSLPGIVQLSDSFSMTNSSIAATSSSVKAAYDLAAACLPSTGGPITGQILASQSDSNAPIYSWSNDQMTGIYSSSNGTIGFTTAGTPVFILNSNGGVLKGYVQVNRMRLCG